MSSQITLTQASNIHLVTHILEICFLISSCCVLFSVYPNRIMSRHPTPLQVITTRAREGGPKEHMAKQKWPLETHSLTFAPGLSTLSYLSRIVSQSQPSFSVSKATLIPSIQPNIGLPSTRPPLTSDINTLLAIWYSSILSTCPNHLNTLCSALLANSFFYSRSVTSWLCIMDG